MDVAVGGTLVGGTAVAVGSGAGVAVDGTLVGGTAVAVGAGVAVGGTLVGGTEVAVGMAAVEDGAACVAVGAGIEGAVGGTLVGSATAVASVIAVGDGGAACVAVGAGIEGAVGGTLVGWATAASGMAAGDGSAVCAAWETAPPSGPGSSSRSPQDSKSVQAAIAMRSNSSARTIRPWASMTFRPDTACAMYPYYMRSLPESTAVNGGYLFRVGVACSPTLSQ